MESRLSAPSPQERRFAAYMEGLAEAAGHAERNIPLKNYCIGLLLPGERKSVEPMAARLDPENVHRMHQSLHHLVADAPWNDEEMLTQLRRQVLPAMRKKLLSWHGSWMTRVFRNTASTRRHRAAILWSTGKHGNCQAAVSLSVSTWSSSLPIAWRLYLQEAWCQDRECRQQAGVPEENSFQTRPEIVLEQLRRAVEQKIPLGVVLVDAGYGNGMPFRTAVTALGLQYVAGHRVFDHRVGAGATTFTSPAAKTRARATPKRLQRDALHQPLLVKELALSLPAKAWKNIGWRQGGSRGMLRSQFRRRARASSPSRLQAYRAALGGMAPDRVAEGNIRTHQTLVVQLAG